MNYNLQPLTVSDEPFLWEMLYQAIYVLEGELPPSREIVYEPDLARYVQDWGRAGDCGFLAIDPTTGQCIGAVWLRLFTGANKGYGYIDNDTPELSIAIAPEYRGQGIGTQLLDHLFASKCGQSTVSLSVSADNSARRLYERFGFAVVSEIDGSITMKRDQ